MKKTIYLIIFLILVYFGGYYTFSKININNQDDNIQDSDTLDKEENTDTKPNEEERKINENNFNNFKESLEANAILSIIKDGVVPTFDFIYNQQHLKYECEDKKVNYNGTVYLKNCKVGDDYFSSGENLLDNQITNEFSRLSILKNEEFNYYYVLKDANLELNNDKLIDTYVCKSKICNYNIFDNYIIISDLKVVYKDLNDIESKFIELTKTKTYSSIKPNINRDFYFEYYKLEDLDIYRTIMYASNYIEEPIILIDNVGYGVILRKFYPQGSGYWYLSFNDETLDNAYYLYASISYGGDNYNDTKYIHNFKTGEVNYKFDEVNEQYFYSDDLKYYVGNYGMENFVSEEISLVK